MLRLICGELPQLHVGAATDAEHAARAPVLRVERDDIETVWLQEDVGAHAVGLA